jgi:hypothetical protein
MPGKTRRLAMTPNQVKKLLVVTEGRTFPKGLRLRNLPSRSIRPLTLENLYEKSRHTLTDTLHKIQESASTTVPGLLGTSAKPLSKHRGKLGKGGSITRKKRSSVK